MSTSAENKCPACNGSGRADYKSRLKIAKRLVELRKKHSLSAHDVRRAMTVRLTPQAMCRIEHGQAPISPEVQSSYKDAVERISKTFTK